MSLTSPTATEIEAHYQRTLLGTAEEKAESLAWLTAANMQMLLGHQFLVQHLAKEKSEERSRCLPSVLHGGW